MSLERNIQGSGDARLEDANAGLCILRSSVSNSTDGKTTVYSLPIIEKSKIILRLNGKYIDDASRGDMINPYDFIRVYIEVPNKDNVDIKITKVLGTTSSPDTTIIEGIIAKGDGDDITVGDNVSWVFYQQETEVINYPINLLASRITSNSSDLTWEDSTPFKEARYYQVMWRALGSTNYLYSPVLDTNIYTISGLIPNTTYECSVMSYFSKDLKTYSKYTPSLKIATR